MPMLPGKDIRAFGALDSSIDAGSGDDSVNINASANSWGWNDPATAKGLANSDVDLGSGNDRLWVNASSSGGNPSHRR